MPQGKDRPAKKNTCPVTCTLLVERTPIIRMAAMYATIITKSRVGMSVWFGIQ
jgi:hypothetical protein